jgi:hypothetical protein
MSVRSWLVRGVLARLVRALGLDTPAASVERAGEAAKAPVDPSNAPDLRDRERELRILMSNWM